MTMTEHTGRGGRVLPSTIREEGTVRRDWWPLVRLIAVLLAAGAALYATAGPPRPPSAVPDLLVAFATLRGSSIPLELLGYVLSTLAWLIWAWLSASVVIRVGIALVDVATHGAAWVSSLRGITDIFTLPLVRRAVDSALAVALVVQVVGRAAPAHAAELASEPPSIVRMVDSLEVERGARVASYTVQSADTLWSIAERFYGTGHEYPRLVDANVGREMADGGLFAEIGVIQPGWTLRVPLPSTALEEQDGEVFYTVERGDTLWGISARFLGDPTRWPEIYEQNQGSAALPDGRTLRDPNLIWPTLRLRVPMAVEAEVEPRADVPIAFEGVSVDAAESAAHVDAMPAVSDAMPAVSDAMPAVSDAMPAVSVDSGADAVNGAAAGGVALAGMGMAAALLVRRRGRRGLDEPPMGDDPESDYVVRGGFAELVDLSRDRDNSAEVAAHQVLRFFDERGLEGRVGLISTRHGRSSTTLALVSQRLADRPRLVEAASGLASRLGVDVTSQLSRDHDVVVRLRNPRLARLGAVTPRPVSAPCQLLPVGVLPDRRVLSVNWPAVGHVLVAGRARGATSNVVTSLVAVLAAQRRPEELQIVTLAGAGLLSSALERLPHQMGSTIDPTDQLAATAAMHDVRAELLRRMERVERGGSVATLPELVLVLPELDGLLEHLSTLEMLGAYGPAHRVRVLAGTVRSRDLPDRLVAHFATRAVLRLPDEGESTRLLGSAAAVDMLGGGQLLLRLDQREPVEAYAFRVAEGELDRLVRVLRGEPAEPDVPAHRRWAERDDSFDFDEIASTPPAAPKVPPVNPRPGAPTVEVRCFGGFDVVSGDRDLTAASSPGEAAEQAGAWQLLAYLSSRPEGLALREDVLVALWPGLDARGANTVLRRTLEHLNGLLQPALTGLAEPTPAVWLDDRDGTLRLDLKRVESDVHRFIRLCRAASLMPAQQAAETWARARALYRGDLLDGPGARAYAWAEKPTEDGELALREQYREQFYRATLRQARVLVNVGQPGEAVPLFHALLQVEPLLEDVVRDLYRCFGVLGDVDALVEEQQRLHAALRRSAGPDEDPDPEPATAALFARIRQDLELKATVPA